MALSTPLRPPHHQNGDSMLSSNDSTHYSAIDDSTMLKATDNALLWVEKDVGDDNLMDPEDKAMPPYSSPRSGITAALLWNDCGSIWETQEPWKTCIPAAGSLLPGCSDRETNTKSASSPTAAADAAVQPEQGTTSPDGAQRNPQTGSTAELRPSPSSSSSSCLWPSFPSYSHCFEDTTVASAAASQPTAFDAAVPELLHALERPGKARTAALLTLYRMTDRQHAEQRVRLVCTSKYNLLGTITDHLLWIPETDDNDSNDENQVVAAHDRRQALLLLNNLCIPVENKAVIILGAEPAVGVLPALLRILAAASAESYLAAACLYNLSFLSEAADELLTYFPPQPPQSTQHPDGAGTGRVDKTVLPSTPRETDPLLQDNLHRFILRYDQQPQSVVWILEDILRQSVPVILHSWGVMPNFQPTMVTSNSNRNTLTVQGETVRWCVGALRNMIMAGSVHNVHMIGTQTEIPVLLLTYVQAWTVSSSSASDNGIIIPRDSLADFALKGLFVLAKHDGCVSCITPSRAHQALDPLLSTALSSSSASAVSTNNISSRTADRRQESILSDTPSISSLFRMNSVNLRTLMAVGTVSPPPPLIQRGGIHALRARAILERIDRHATGAIATNRNFKHYHDEEVDGTVSDEKKDDLE